MSEPRGEVRSDNGLAAARAGDLRLCGRFPVLRAGFVFALVPEYLNRRGPDGVSSLFRTRTAPRAEKEFHIH